MHFLPRVLRRLFPLGLLLVAGSASAQTIGPSPNPYPDRNVPLRPQNLNPQGVSFSDCMADAVLTFQVVVSGFDGTQNIQIWASASGDCTSLAARGIGAAAATCWLLPGGMTGQSSGTETALDFELRVQDLVGPQNAPPFPPGYQKQDATACQAQKTPAAVPLQIAFLPMDTTNQDVIGTPYVYMLQTDLVGPPAPADLSLGVRGTDWVASWTPNDDADTIGYDVFFATGAQDSGANCVPSSQEVAATGAEPSAPDPTIGTYDFGAAQSDSRAGISVAAVDAFDNLGPATGACASAGEVQPTTVKGCACSAAGASASSIADGNGQRAGGGPLALLACLGASLLAVLRLSRRRWIGAVSPRRSARRAGAGS